jgi:tryptophanyl-tRNA synthetase
VNSKDNHAFSFHILMTTIQRVFSGIQPTGIPHLGNFLGALRNWTTLQDHYEAIYSIVDLHAITLPQDPSRLRKSTREMAMAIIASGIDPCKSILFRQSRIKEHTELGWILNCSTPVSWLQRMHQYKTKGDKNPMLGLLSYPVLQAADILLYQANIVPVGEDQSQHMNLTTDIAKSFNARFGSVFVIPSPSYGSTQSMRIMSLKEPTKKMSKSDPSDLSRIELTDSPESIRTKIRKATTDSLVGITYNPEKRPGITNLLDILFALQKRTGTMDELNDYTVQEFGHKKTSELKDMVADCVIEHLQPIRKEYKRLESGTDLDLILEKGEQRARDIAQETLHQVHSAIGLK